MFIVPRTQLLTLLFVSEQLQQLHFNRLPVYSSLLLHLQKNLHFSDMYDIKTTVKMVRR